MARCRNVGVLTPAIYLVDIENRRIIMEWIDGITFKEYLYTIGMFHFISILFYIYSS